MTRRRDIEPLALTITEAAEALRMDPHLLRSWVKAGLVRTVTWNKTTFVPVVECHRLIESAMASDKPMPTEPQRPDPTKAAS